jgi:hypothetical protein
MLDEQGRARFPKRVIDALDVSLNATDRRLHKLLDTYTRLRLAQEVTQRELLPVRFALTLLKKRLLSSPLAFANSLQVYADTVSKAVAASGDLELVKRLTGRMNEDTDDDEERDNT